MRTQTKKLTKGFTIIEVLIVLAIAGLILAIIFLAVPALQRNSRNTSIRSDAASILSGVNDFVANNQGQLPTTVACAGGTVTITGAVGSTASEARVRGGTTCNATGTMPSQGPPPQTGLISIALGSRCQNNAFQASARSVAAGFLVENTGSTTAAQCIDG